MCLSNAPTVCLLKHTAEKHGHATSITVQGLQLFVEVIKWESYHNFYFPGCIKNVDKAKLSQLLERALRFSSIH